VATYKTLGQAAPAANVFTDLYTTPAATQTVMSTLAVCNRATASCTYRVAVRVGGAALNAAHYLVYDASLPGNQTTTLTIGIAMAATDVLTVSASSPNVTFAGFGVENP